ncbi:SDR family NAD(P)-dependent oxidoreductase [Yoonia sp. I 8.24]|uniref:SDR family NAD(P)-dependent oxidoreductase n=1 Tax=Yoonia sp. I 8.24 TaxID=1537229 RepID=UPI001EE0188E|nr:SDR family NAD(P)-dependent oxidoreductase [Yoonia sp. I 8.24]MCG3268766.1 SDR family NAD(P)-dependent oxidoreductase [Yoonia sp. I 8.24]
MTRVLITGANRGIGAALCMVAAEAGADVIRATRPGRGGDIVFDVTDPETVTAAVRQVAGPIDIVINNAGIIGPNRQSTTDMDYAGMAETFAVNVAGPLAVSNACLAQLGQSNAPRILTVSSQMAWMGYAKSDRIAYRASKAAVNKVMQGLATDLQPRGIAVALVDPGWVRTDMGGADADLAPTEVASGIWALATRLTLADTGKFFKWNGSEREF